MHLKSAVALALTLVSAEAVHQGFNYGAAKVDGSSKVQSDFEAEFKTAKNLVGTSGFTSARLYTMIQGGTANDPISAIPAAIAEETSLLLGLWASGGGMDNEIAALKKAIDQYGDAFTKLVVGISVGSEDLYRNSVDGVKAHAGIGINPDELVSYIEQVRSTISGTSLSDATIGHVDTWTAWVNGTNSAVIEACDWLGFDGYPYFQNTMPNSIEDAKALFDEAVGKTQAAAGGKEVWITETGWPVSGKTENLAVANTENAKVYWDEVGCPLFGNVNTWWYILEDAGASPSFGVVGSDLSTTPLYDLSCKGGSSSSSSSASASSSSASSVASAGAAGASSGASTGSGSSSGSGSAGVAADSSGQSAGSTEGSSGASSGQFAGSSAGSAGSGSGSGSEGQSTGSSTGSGSEHAAGSTGADSTGAGSSSGSGEQAAGSGADSTGAGSSSGSTGSSAGSSTGSGSSSGHGEQAAGSGADSTGAGSSSGSADQSTGSSAGSTGSSAGSSTGSTGSSIGSSAGAAGSSGASSGSSSGASSGSSGSSGSGSGSAAGTSRVSSSAIIPGSQSTPHPGRPNIPSNGGASRVPTFASSRASSIVVPSPTKAAVSSHPTSTGSKSEGSGSGSGTGAGKSEGSASSSASVPLATSGATQLTGSVFSIVVLMFAVVVAV